MIRGIVALSIGFALGVSIALYLSAREKLDTAPQAVHIDPDGTPDTDPADGLPDA